VPAQASTAISHVSFEIPHRRPPCAALGLADAEADDVLGRPDERGADEA